ncbi:hypothetical protein OAX78_01785 [Planctomycetota bacterium]|nr:hypothetical protein [Planctomycetota bacterium]
MSAANWRDPIQLLAKGLEAFPKEELVTALRQHYERRLEGRMGPNSDYARTDAPDSDGDASPAAQFLNFVEDAKARLRTGVLDRPGDPAERARAQLLDHYRVIRRHTERVDKFVERQRNSAAAPRSPLPQRLMQVSANPGGVGRGRFRLVNGLQSPATAGLRAAAFCTRDGQRRATANVAFEPAAPALAPGSSCVVTVAINLANTPFVAGDQVAGDVFVTLAGVDVLWLGVELTVLEVPPAQPKEATGD